MENFQVLLKTVDASCESLAPRELTRADNFASSLLRNANTNSQRIHELSTDGLQRRKDDELALLCKHQSIPAQKLDIDRLGQKELRKLLRAQRADANVHLLPGETPRSGRQHDEAVLAVLRKRAKAQWKVPGLESP